MKNAFDMERNEKYNGNAVLVRGYEIYDEWKSNKLNSRKLVAHVERAVALMHANGNRRAHIEALSYLFALDMRIKERYGTILRCLFLYFSWRREVRTLKWLSGELHISHNMTDIRAVIELELQKIREGFNGDELDGEDDEARGGKQNGKVDEEIANNNARQDELAEHAPEQAADTKEIQEAAHEEANDPSDNTPTEENVVETEDFGEPKESIEVMQEDAENAKSDGKEKVQESKQDQIKEENNEPETNSEPITDKAKETKAYNDAVDSPPLYEEVTVNDKKEEKLSFIDEVIIDNMVKGKEDFVTHNPLEDLKPERDAHQAIETKTQQDEKIKDSNLKDDLSQTDKGSEQSDKQVKNDEKASESVSKGNNNPEDARVQIQIDMTAGAENEMIGNLNDSLTEEMAQYLKAAMEIEAREQLKIASEEFGIDAPVEIVGKTDLAELQQTHAAPDRH